MRKNCGIEMGGKKWQNMVRMIVRKKVESVIVYGTGHWKYVGTAKFSHLFSNLSHPCVNQ